MENSNLFIQNLPEKIEQNLNKFAEAIREGNKNSINAQRQENNRLIIGLAKIMGYQVNMNDFKLD